MRNIILILLTLSAILFRCSKTNSCQELSFDERQCGSDSFLSAGSDDEKLVQARDYLQAQGIDVIASDYDPNFHDAVCQSCDVCPTSLRFFFEVKPLEASDLNDLDLLNAEIGSCP
ncbi:MAG: hypothetical protein KDC57_16530 [Saprospiraceae bacterium]|nr:hypothetical protein [Saprospiraceae bacterium]